MSAGYNPNAAPLPAELAMSLTELAALLKQVLKAKWPAVNFRVRSKRYSGGQSIDIEWLDGPPTSEVDAVVLPYEGRGFDGSIDLAFHYKHLRLADGSIVPAGTGGTSSSGGVFAPWSVPIPEGAERIDLPWAFIHTHRRLSRELCRAVETIIRARYGYDTLLNRNGQIDWAAVIDRGPRKGTACHAQIKAAIRELGYFVQPKLTAN